MNVVPPNWAEHIPEHIPNIYLGIDPQRVIAAETAKFLLSPHEEAEQFQYDHAGGTLSVYGCQDGQGTIESPRVGVV